MLLPASPALSQEGSSSTEEALAMAEEVAREVESIRGWKFKHPVEKHVYSEDQLKEYVIRILEREYPDEETRLTEAFLHTTGLLPKSVPLKQTIIDVLLSQVGGFYDPTTKSFYMIERAGVDYGPVVNRILIAHELTHALDDQYVNLDSLQSSRTRTEDGEFILGAMIEGSATALMTTYVTKAQLAGELQTEDLMKLMKSEEERSKVFFEAPIYFQTLVAYYTCGMVFFLEGNLAAVAGGGEQVGKNFLAAVADPPTSSEQILHPEKYWDEETREEPVLVDGGAMNSLLEAAGFKVAGKNTAGEILMGVVTTPTDRVFNAMASGLPAYWTNKASMGWGGDRFYLLEAEEGFTGIWVTLWDTGEDRGEFLETYEAEVRDESRSRFLLGERGAVFTFGLREAEVEKIGEMMADSPPGFTQAGVPWTP
jgi:hypothetical protein